MLAEYLNKIAYECFEFFSAYFTLDFVGLPSPIFRPYGEDCSFETRYFTDILQIFFLRNVKPASAR